MAEKYLEYPLHHGYIHHWLVAGPQALPVTDIGGLPESEAERSQDLARRFYQPLSGPAAPPVDRGEYIPPAEPGGDGLTWSYTRCSVEDHLVDISAEYPALQYLRAWAFVQLNSRHTGQVTFQLHTPGPAEVWLNGQIVYRAESFTPPEIRSALAGQRFPATLRAENELLVRFEALGWGATRQVMALQIVDLAASADDEAVTLRLATPAKFPHRHKKVEALFEKARLKDVVSYKGNLVPIRWADDAEMTTSYSYKVCDVRKQIYVEGHADVKLEDYDAGHPQRLWERPYHISLRAIEVEYWEQNLRYERILPFQVLDTEYTPKARGNYAWRRLRALEYASRREGTLFGEIAKMIQGSWDKLDSQVIQQAVEQVNQASMHSPVLLVGLLGMLQRYQAQDGFPQGLEKQVEAAALKFSYQPLAEDCRVESHTILTWAAAVLAGQLFPRRSFASARQTGSKLRQQAESAALEWMRQRGVQGFAAWNSPEEIEQVIVALTHLTSLAASQAVRELAAVLLDKILFLLAVNSHQGVYAAAQKCANPWAVKSGQLQATAGIHCLLFGAGVFNHYIAGLVSLVCAEYEFPSFFAEIAANPPAELLHQERQVSQQGQAANLVTYRTPDYILSSVQDYHPGAAGCAEHIWQATLGSETQVFTNHPAVMADLEGSEPGFWLGNASLPRVAQWQEHVIAVYNLPDDDWMGFTHAHFPQDAFDETVFAKGWAFARQGEAFIGLTCSQGFEQVKHGRGAYRELRAAGRQNVWLCMLGRKAVQQGFRKFQKKCIASKPAWQDLGVQFTSLKGDQVVFGWQGPLTVNGQEQPLNSFKHIQNPYCRTDVGAAQMDIQYADILMRLNFE